MNWKHIFKKTFNTGDEVVIEDSEGYYLWGTIGNINKNGINLKSKGLSKGQDWGRREIFLYWEDIVFIAQDGFPVREMTETSFKQAYELASDQSEQEMREYLLSYANKSKVTKYGNVCPYCKADTYVYWKQEKGEYSYCGYPDSHRFYPEYKDTWDKIREERRREGKKEYEKQMSRKSTSVGFGCPFVSEDVFVKEVINIGNNYGHWGMEDEEVLILESKDGAIMHSYDIDHLFIPR